MRPYTSATGRASAELLAVTRYVDGATLRYWVTAYEVLTELTVTIHPDYTTTTDFELFPRWEEP